MKIIFEVPADKREIIEDIQAQCASGYTCTNKDSLSGEQIIAITAIITPIVWDLIKMYLPSPFVTIQVELDEKHTVTITDRSLERAKKKAEQYRKQWEEMK